MKTCPTLLLFSIATAWLLAFDTEMSRAVQAVEAIPLKIVGDQKHSHEDESQDSDQGQNEMEAVDDTELESAANPSITTIEGSYIRFHMWDGLIVGGEAGVDAIDVATEFGPLKIPISKILRFYPGLDSMPELQSRIDGLVQDLGDRDFDVREKAHSELLSMGNLLRNEINRFEDGESAERKKHLADLRKKFEEIEEELDEPIRPLIRGDHVETPNFSIVGKIVQKEFRLKSQFGEMTIPLSQIRTGDRTFGLLVPEVRKTVAVEATSFFPEGTRTKIKVNRGDKISIVATGSVHWQNWSTNCGPDGMTDKGQFKSFNSGALLARIGKNNYVLVGDSATFVADSKGELYLGIAMADNYKTGGYTWTGKYDAKIVVKPQANQ